MDSSCVAGIVRFFGCQTLFGISGQGTGAGVISASALASSQPPPRSTGYPKRHLQPSFLVRLAGGSRQKSSIVDEKEVKFGCRRLGRDVNSDEVVDDRSWV